MTRSEHNRPQPVKSKLSSNAESGPNYHHHQAGLMEPGHWRPVPVSRCPRAPWANGDDDCLESGEMGPCGFHHVVCEDSTSGFQRTTVHANSMVVAVTGACPNDGNNGAVKSACGSTLEMDTRMPRPRTAIGVPSTIPITRTSTNEPTSTIQSGSSRRWPSS